MNTAKLQSLVNRLAGVGFSMAHTLYWIDGYNVNVNHREQVEAARAAVIEEIKTLEDSNECPQATGDNHA